MKYSMHDFFDSFIDDLGDFFERTESDPPFQLKKIKFKDFKEEQEKLKEAYNKNHREYIIKNIEKIKLLEGNLSQHLIKNLSDFNIDNIVPVLRPLLHDKNLINKKDSYLIEYMRIYQKVKSRKSIGRENIFILEDHSGHYIKTMGMLILSSPLYFVGKRDKFLSWENSQHYKLIREKGLARMMHLSLCCALPPYNKLGAAKLLSISAFSDVVYDDYCIKWEKKDKEDVDLAIITTSTSMGLTGTPFQRIKLEKILHSDHESSKSNSILWHRVKNIGSHGEAYSYSYALDFLSERSKEIANTLYSCENKPTAAILMSLLKKMGISNKDAQMNKRGFFIGYLNEEALKSIQSGIKRNSRPVIDWENAALYFKGLYDNEHIQNAGKFNHLPNVNAAHLRRRERANHCSEKDIFISSFIN